MKTLVDTKPYKIDKNGTQYFADWTCPRCGGAGIIPHFAHVDGGTCFECGGSGRRANAKTIKVYTPEYEKKLEERRAKRQAKKDAERKANAGAKNIEFLEKKGFSADGKAYIIMGDTYSIKEQLKEQGCRFNYVMGWYSDHDLDGYDTVEMNVEDIYEKSNFGEYIEWFKDGVREAIDEAKGQYAESNDETEYVGEIGKRIELELTLMGVCSYEVPSHSYYREADTMLVYKFEDENGNALVWKTGTGLRAVNEDGYYIHFAKGDKIKVKATVKDHKVYKNKKQTVISRVKVQK